MARAERIQVLLTPDEANLFNRYCKEHGYKKSTLIVRLIREHLEHAGFPEQGPMFNQPEDKVAKEEGFCK